MREKDKLKKTNSKRDREREKERDRERGAVTGTTRAEVGHVLEVCKQPASPHPLQVTAHQCASGVMAYTPPPCQNNT